MRSLAAKEWHAHRRALAFWAGSVALLAMLIVGLFPAYSEGAEGFAEFLENAPAAFRALFGEDLDFGTPAGFLRVEVFSLMAPLLFVVFAVVRGADALAGEEERGQLDMLLSLPLTRRRVYAEAWLGMGGGLAVLVAAHAAALSAGGWLFDVDVPHGGVWVASLEAGLLGLGFGTVAFALGAATGRKAVGGGAAGGLALGAYLLEGLGSLSDAVDPWRAVSPFHYYSGGEALEAPLAAGDLAPLLLLVAGAFAAGLGAFERRDVRG